MIDNEKLIISLHAKEQARERGVSINEIRETPKPSINSFCGVNSSDKL